MRELEIKAWHKEERRMMDLYSITPLALSDGMNSQLAMQGRHGLFIPFFKELILIKYTGLTYKEGEKIWESDIVEMFGIVARYVVKYGAYKRKAFT